VATRLEILNPFYFPPFSKIVLKGYELFANGSIWEHLWFSLTNFAIGLSVSVVLGVLLGVPMGWYKNVSKTFDPLLSGIYATPLIALLPLIIMLFGLGSISKIIMTVLAAVFPILINTMVGIANTDVRLITMARAFGARDSQIFLKVSLPGSLPYIVAGIRVALGRALVYIVVNQGFYKKHGLDVEIIKTNTAAAVQAMLAGKMQMATGAGAAAFVTATLEGAPPFVLVASWVNVFPYKIMAQKGIKKVEDLKGKTGHVGAPFGTIPDTALRFALTRLKIDPDKDVKLVQHSGADPASILAAMEKGEVQFGILAPPFDLIAEKRGYEMLLALPGLGIP